MSYILEALKKSEARRRSGEAPDLTQTPPPTARRGGRWPLLVLTLLVVGAGSALGVWLATNRDGDAPAPAPQHAASPPVAADTNTDTVATKPEEVTTHVAVADRVRRAAGKSTATDPRPAEPALPDTTMFTDSANNATPVTDSDSMVAETAQATPGETASEPPADDSPSATETLADADPRSSLLEDLAAEANERFEAAQAPEPEERVGPPFIHELAWGFRSQLPPMALNVHMYSEDPAQRFVMINMRRYQEGDLMENGNITVQRVVPEGVVLQLEGRDFLLGR